MVCVVVRLYQRSNPCLVVSHAQSSILGIICCDVEQATADDVRRWVRYDLAPSPSMPFSWETAASLPVSQDQFSILLRACIHTGPH